MTTRDKAVAGHMDWEEGMSSSSINVGRRTLDPEMKYSCICQPQRSFNKYQNRKINPYREDLAHEDGETECQLRPYVREMRRTLSSQPLNGLLI